MANNLTKSVAVLWLKKKLKGVIITEELLPVILQALSGVIGGNATGAAMKKKSLGKVGNSIVGLIGGLLGGLLLNYLNNGSIDISSVVESLANGGAKTSKALENIAGGGIGRSVLMALVGMLNNKRKK